MRIWHDPSVICVICDPRGSPDTRDNLDSACVMVSISIIYPVRIADTDLGAGEVSQVRADVQVPSLAVLVGDDGELSVHQDLE